MTYAAATRRRRVGARPPALWALVGALLLVSVGGCAAGRAFSQGENEARNGNWDEAVVFYTRAVQANPDNPSFKIALERAMLNASRLHFTQATRYEENDQLDAALQEYRKASEFDPSNRQAAVKTAALEQLIRDRVEAARPKSPVEQMRERARQSTPEPLLNPASRDPLRIQFSNASTRDILNFVGNATGINVTFDREFQDRSYSVQLDSVTLEQALNQILSTNELFYKVVDEHTIIVIPDTPQKRAQYEEQVIRTFYVSNADVQELAQLISSVIRVPQMPVQPMVAVNKTSNTITVRATASVADIIDRIISANDKPRAEIVLDVEILEVNRTRAKQYGLNLSQYALGGIFSPEVAPPNNSTAPEGVGSPPPFNLNTITRGVSTADFYAAVPAAFVRFLETDSETKLIAKPQLRGSEGTKLTLNLGDEIPVPSTVFTPIATGGAATNPLTSFSYRPVGVNVEMTPRVTFDGDIILDLLVESSTLGQDINIAGNSLPTFGSRKVVTRLRLREGESNLLAGLLREDERRSLRGFPGIMRLPILRQLLSDNDNQISQTDIVMLLTPRIVRTHELTDEDLAPIYIGTQQNIGLSGPPPLIAAPGMAELQTDQPATGEPVAEPVVEAPGPAAVGFPEPRLPDGATAVPTMPAGSSPIPGMTTAPPTEPAPTVDPAPTSEPTPAAPPEPAPVARPDAPPVAQGPPTGVPPVPDFSPPAPGDFDGPPETEPVAPSPGEPGLDPAEADTSPAPLEERLPPAQVILTPPGSEFRVGGGPYIVPLSISGASQVSDLSVTLVYSPALLRVRSVQEGSFMRQGGVTATFSQDVDPEAGRIDLTIQRVADRTGASGSGLLAAVLFEAISTGRATVQASGVARTPTGDVVPLTFAPIAVEVQ